MVSKSAFNKHNIIAAAYNLSGIFNVAFARYRTMQSKIVAGLFSRYITKAGISCYRLQCTCNRIASAGADCYAAL